MIIRPTKRTHGHTGIGWAFVLALSLGMGCGQSSGDAVARYKERILYRAELKHHLPPDATGADSARLAQAYISRWVREQYIADLAADSIPGLQERISFQLEDYRRKLSQLELERYLLAKHLDTVVTMDQLAAYHQAHAEEFRASEYRFRVRYLVVPLQAVTPSLAREFFNLDTNALAGISKQAEIAYLDDRWVPPDSLRSWQRSAPPGYVLASARPGGPVLQFPGRNPKKPRMHYFLLREVIQPGETLPLSAVADELYRLILEERHYQLLEKFQAKVAQEVENQSDVQIF